MSGRSKIFLRHRALGYVSNHVPCIIKYVRRRQEHVVITCVDKSFHIYGLEHLSLYSVSDTTENEIACLAADESRIYTASGGTIESWERGTVVDKFWKGHNKPIHILVSFGRQLLSVDEDNVLKVWDKKSAEVYLEMSFDILSFRITSILHPSTYLNKVLIGCEQGYMQLWNLRTSKTIHTFKNWNASIIVLEQAPALDVVAVGLNDGHIILHNIRYDEVIMEFTQDWGPVVSISFRTDGQPIMLTGSTSGHIVIWDLENRKVASQLLEAHSAPVSSIKCLPNEPMMLTSSSDNSLKMWIFDQPDHGARLLRLREGHAAQPNCIRYYPGNPNHILSAGSDSSLRLFNTINESMNISLGKASYNRKTAKKKKEYAEALLMPPIVEFTAVTAREKDWDNIAALHLDSAIVTSWSYDKRKMGEHKLLPERLTHKTRVTLTVAATSVHLTNCGNFLIIGYSSGHVDRFSIQSGIHRCVYGANRAHKAAIRGVASDPLNQLVISGCSDGLIKFWKFQSDQPNMQICSKPSYKISLGEPISFFRLHGESSLVCVVQDDFIITLVDMETKKIVRKLSGHTGQITDCTFSPDARWLISAGLDSTIRTWDIPTSSLIDIFKVDSPCISLDMSPTGQYLATIHVNNLGIYTWTNRTMFSCVSLRAIDSSAPVPNVEMPTSTGVAPVIIDHSDDEMEITEPESPKQIEGLITMSELASSRWQNLLNLNIIKERNKAKEIKKSENAPFFLPTLPTIDVQFDFSSFAVEEDGIKTLRLDKLENYTAFGRLLNDSKSDNGFQNVLSKLKEMGPSAIDLEINSLSLGVGNSVKLLHKFLNFIKWLFSTKKDFELAQSYLGLFVKTHSNVLTENKDLKEVLADVLVEQSTSWDKIQNDLMFCLCVIDTLKQPIGI